jgi:hypothetical protein
MRYIHNIKIMLAAVLIVSASPAPSFAIFGNPAGTIVRETVECCAKKFGIELGQVAGKQFSKSAARFIARYGDDGATALKNIGPRAIDLTGRHGKDVVRICAAHSDDAARYLVTNIDDALPIWRTFGKEGTDIMVKHPGLAKPLLDTFGKKGITIGKKLSTESLEKFLVLTSKVGEKDAKETLLEKALLYGDEILEFLWRHKWKIISGVAVYEFIKDYEDGLETAQTGPDGNTIEKTRTYNFIQHVFTRILDKTLARYPWLPLAFIILIIFWLWPSVRLVWSIPRRIMGYLRKRKAIKPHTQPHMEPTGR